MSLQRRLLAYRARGFRPVGRDAAGKDELLDLAAGPIHDADGFHHPGRSGDIDLPHALDVENPAALRIEDEGEMDDGTGAGVAQQLGELRATGLAAQVQGWNSSWPEVDRWAHIHAHHVKIGE